MITLKCHLRKMTMMNIQYPYSQFYLFQLLFLHPIMVFIALVINNFENLYFFSMDEINSRDEREREKDRENQLNSGNNHIGTVN